MSNTILVSAFFNDRGHDTKLAYFEDLDRSLRKRGFEIYLLNLNSRRLNSSCESESLPVLISKAHWLPHAAVAGRSEQDPAVRHAASIDALCWGRSVHAESYRVARFREHLRRLIKRVDPCLYIAWHEFFSLHHFLPSLLLDEFPSLPFLFTEFGPLPGTIVFDDDGQMGESRVAQRPAEYAALPVTGDDLSRAAAFIERVRTEKRSRKPQAASADTFAAIEERLAAAETVIFYAGQYDFRTGMVPRTLPHARTHSPWFADTFDALSSLNEIAERHGWLVLFKPHPLDTGYADRMSPLESLTRVALVPGVNIFDCFARADVVVTIVSQVNYMALIHQKPCVTLGRTYLWDKGCDHQPKDRGDVERSLLDAVRSGFTPSQQERWRRHVAQLLKYTVFAFDRDLSHDMLRDLDSTAEFLIESSRSARPPVTRA